LVLAKFDALLMHGYVNPEVDAELDQESELKEWYWLLDCGFRIPLVGGSGKDCNLSVLGHPRTYARLQAGQEFTYKNWIEAIRAGKTFVTNGPMLFFTVNGQDPGALIELPSEASPVQIRAEVRSLVPFRRLQVVANSEVVAEATPTGSPASAVLEAEVAMPTGGWLVARCWGKYDDCMEQWIGAQSSPIHVTIAGQRLQADAGKLTYFVGLLDQMLEWVRSKARCETDQERVRLAGIFQQARASLVERGK
jgi:hypothetical protein